MALRRGMWEGGYKSRGGDFDGVLEDWMMREGFFGWVMGEGGFGMEDWLMWVRGKGFYEKNR